MNDPIERPTTRTQRRRTRNLDALISAGYEVISAKGIDAATMGEIAELADVGSGTVYNYFASKDDLVIAVMERVMRRLGERIEQVTNAFKDPGHVYAFGIRSVMRATIEDERWHQLCRRSEIGASAMFRVMGPFAIRDLEAAKKAGRYDFKDAALIWRMATHAIIAFGLGVHEGEIKASLLDDAVIALLGMVGVSATDARKIVKRKWSELPPE